MKIHSSLFAKILTWFFVNLVLVGVLIWVVYTFQIGPASPFLGQSEDRIRSAAIAISGDLVDTPRTGWSDVLREHENRFGDQVKFHLLDGDRKAVVGKPVEFPGEVLDMVPSGRDQPNYSRRLTENRYRDLNATASQITEIMEALRNNFKARNDLNAELRQRDLDPDAFRVEYGNRRQKLDEELQNEIRSLLKEEQISLYDRLLASERSRWPRQVRLILPRSEQQFSVDFAKADQDSDGMLGRDESRQFIEGFSRTIPRGRQFRRSRPPGNDPNGKGPERPPEKGSPSPVGGPQRQPSKQNVRNSPANPQRPTRNVFTLTTSNPVRYWAGLEIPVKILDFNATLSSDDPVDEVSGLRVESRPRERRNHFLATLVFESESLGAGGLFSDPLPWVPIVIAAVALSAIFWLPMVRNITRPIAEVTAATELIAEGRFDTRVGTARGDEIGRVGQAVDHMADRLAGFVKGQKRFLGDISHELCSPIARIQAALANLEQRADDSQKKYVADLSEEVEHMSELVDELLMFSRAGMKPAEVKLQPVLLSEAVQRVIDREGAAATNLNVDIDDGLKATADPKLLSRALGNLVRNAIRYAGQAGHIELRAGKKADLIRITIADQGPGISPGVLPYIFDPFSRPEEARSRDTGGAGLGLSIVKSCIEACGGTIDCRNRKPTGMEFIVTLPGA